MTMEVKEHNTTKQSVLIQMIVKQNEITNDWHQSVVLSGLKRKETAG